MSAVLITIKSSRRLSSANAQKKTSNISTPLMARIIIFWQQHTHIRTALKTETNFSSKVSLGTLIVNSS